jgi:hypothetical protein
VHHTVVYLREYWADVAGNPPHLIAWYRAGADEQHRGRTTVTVQTGVRDEAGKLVAQTTQIQAQCLPG